MIIYILLVFIMFVLSVFDSKIKKELNLSNVKNKKSLSFFGAVGFIILFLFSAFRFNIGWDYMAYHNTIKYNLVTNIVNNNEYMTIMLIKISRYFDNPSLYFAINAFLTLYLILKTIKYYSKDYWLSVIFFICFPLFYLNSLSVVRIFTAISIIFYSTTFIEKKSFVKYLICIILASMFHKTALFAIIFYPLKTVNIRLIHLFLVLALTQILNKLTKFLVISYFPTYISYINLTNKQEGGKAIYVFILIGVLSIILKDKIINDNYVNKYIFNSFFIGLITYTIFLNYGTLGHRLSLYGTIYSLLLIPLISGCINNIRVKMIFKYCTICLSLVFYMYTIIVGAVNYLPYKTILF